MTAEFESMTDRDEMRDAHDETVGAGSPNTAPHDAPPVSRLEGQPAAIIGTVVAAIDAVLVAAIPLPEWLTTVLVAVTTIAGALGIRAKVTPTARPRDNAGEPLTP